MHARCTHVRALVRGVCRRRGMLAGAARAGGEGTHDDAHDQEHERERGAEVAV